jgi:hypothetical protein
MPSFIFIAAERKKSLAAATTIEFTDTAIR